MNILTTEVLPDHTQLPETDGSIVTSFQEHPQSILLTDAIRPVLDRLHPDGRYCIGQDCGIYWKCTDPPLLGCKAPDWFYVPNVPPMLDGKYRRSYVMWKELIAPFIILEFVSGDGEEERDRTPETGKFWVYEQVLRAPYYGIYEADPGRIELYHWVDGSYEPVLANARGHFAVPRLGVELGIWRGKYLGMDLPWMRWWDSSGTMLPTGDERAERERQRADQERQRADQERQRAERERQRAESAEKQAEHLAARLRALGVDPNK